MKLSDIQIYIYKKETSQTFFHLEMKFILDTDGIKDMSRGDRGAEILILVSQGRGWDRGGRLEYEGGEVIDSPRVKKSIIR